MITPEPKYHRPLRVAFVGHSAQLGGGELALVELIRHLDRRRVEPIVILFSDGPLLPVMREIAETHLLLVDTAIRDRRKDTLSGAAILDCSAVRLILLTLFRLSKLFTSLNLDIVHTNSLKAHLLAGVAARICKLPALWHVRDRISPDYLPRFAIKTTKALSLVVPSFVIANSAATLKSLSSGHLWARTALSSRSMVIHDGVDPERYLEVHPGGRSSRLTIGVIGRISPWKGQDIFLKAAARLRRDFNEVVFRVIGDPLFGEEAYQRQLLALCTELDLGDRVQFTGFVSNIPEQLADLDIVVHSSVIGEPFGQVIIEAMAAGKPLIATDGGGVPEIVVDGATGLLVPMGDVEAMAAAMDRLVSNPKIRERMGRSGRDRARRVFHIDQTVKKLHRVYEMMRPAPTPPRELDSASKSKRGDSSPVKLDAVLSDLNVVARHQDLATGSTPKLSTGIARLLQAITRGWERRVLDPTG